VFAAPAKPYPAARTPDDESFCSVFQNQPFVLFIFSETKPPESFAGPAPARVQAGLADGSGSWRFEISCRLTRINASYTPFS
jgi:hypothetical protein